MIGIIVGGLLVTISLYKLYFLLKPLIQVSNVLVKNGMVKDISAYTDEIEQLRAEILELNDAFYNQLNTYEKRIEVLESQLEVLKRPFRKDVLDKSPENPQFEVRQEKLKTARTQENVTSQKVIHPLFDRVKGLYKLGYKDQDIARELSIGVSEVQLLIKRIEES